MYITANNQTYQNIKFRRAGNVSITYTGESLNLETVSGEIVLYRNDGFVLRQDNVSDYLRSELGVGYIKLTNEPIPEPQPTEASDTEILNTLLGVNDEEDES